MENTNAGSVELFENDVTEIGPNDIVIHLVNPYKCGICEEEYLERSVFMKHMLLHLKGLKEENPTSQLTMSISKSPNLSRGITVTRDILQLKPDGTIKQVQQLPKNIKPDQVKPLRELEEAGVINLNQNKQESNLQENRQKDHQPTVNHSPSSIPVGLKETTQSSMNTVPIPERSGVLQDFSKDKNQSAEDLNISQAALIANDDGTFRFSLKPLKMENQHIEIVPISQNEIEEIITKTKPLKKLPVPKSKVYRKKTYECDICGKHLSCSTSLSRHKQYHKAEKPFVCEVCNRGFKDNSNLKKHTLIHKREFACHMCKRTFLHKSLLTAHLRYHESRSTFIKNGNSSEEVIVKTAVQSDGTHLETVSMKCLENFSFEAGEKTGAEAAENFITGMKSDVRDDSLKGSQRTPGDIARMYKCGHCGKETIQRGNVMRHLLHHLRQKLSCQICHKRFINRSELIKHENSHIRPLSSTNNLGLVMQNDEDINEHVDSIVSKINGQSKSFKCHLCPLTFSRKLFLDNHKRRHIGNTEFVFESADYGLLQDWSGFYCKHCNKNLPKKYRMMCHVKIHDKDCKYECQKCNKCFRTRYLLQQHLKIHMTYCKLCKEKFRGKLALKLHLKECQAKKQNKVDHAVKIGNELLNIPPEKQVPGNRLPDVGNKRKFESQTKSRRGYRNGQEQGSLNKYAVPQRMSTDSWEKEVKEISQAQGNSASRWYSCGICQSKFRQLKSLSDHLKTHKAREDQIAMQDIPSRESDVPFKGRLQKGSIEIEAVIKKQGKKSNRLHASTGSSQKESIEIESGTKRVNKGKHRWHTCALCQNKFESFNDLSQHLKSHSLEKDKITAIQTPEQHEYTSKDPAHWFAPSNVNKSSLKEKPSLYECALKQLTPVSVLKDAKEYHENSITPRLENSMAISTSSVDNLMAKAVGGHDFFSDTASKKKEVESEISSADKNPGTDTDCAKKHPYASMFPYSSTTSSEKTLASEDEIELYVISSVERHKKGTNEDSIKRHEAYPSEANQILTQDVSTVSMSTLFTNQQPILNSSPNIEKIQDQTVNPPLSVDKVFLEKNYGKKRKSVCIVSDNKGTQLTSKRDLKEGLGKNFPMGKKVLRTCSSKERKSVEIVSYWENDEIVQKILPLPSEPILEGLKKKKLKESKPEIKEKNEQETVQKTETFINRRKRILKIPLKFLS
ncbi:hypothetical protein EGW08_013239 [Elysia chlorotica]|uniref:C2H2-type domain-containing protein n=1 Tax=Elysia chlorotica TaxID=188477 RepID=A0A3S1B3G3_ELYCH|nr:hypothetical protein EGW08_013239 [Elysia chlorotica]